MKRKLFLWTVGLTALANLSVAQQTVTLDVSRPVQAGDILLDPAQGYWTESFTPTPLELEHFTLAHDGGSSAYGDYWRGFSVGSNGDSADYGSPNSASTDGWLLHQWGNMAGGGILTDGEGRVVRDAEGRVTVEKGIPYIIASQFDAQGITFDARYEPVGIYLNNHPWPFYSNLYGDAFARALDREGDFFKVVITGLDTHGDPRDGDAEWHETGRAEHLFAEYRDGELHQSADWQWADLSAIGTARRLTFALESSDTGDWGMNTSAYFCLDRLEVRTAGTDRIITPEVTAVRVYPNPVVDRLLVSGAALEHVTVTDMGGRTVFRLRAGGESQLSIPAGSWAKGVYVVRVVDRSGTSSHKVVRK
jgi:hypothetical protein